MTTLEERLRDLADLAPRQPRPLAEIRLRQRQLVRSRRAGRLAGGGALLALALLAAQVVFGGLGPFGGPGSILGTSATAGGANCTGYAEGLDRAQVLPELRYLLSGDAYGRPLTTAFGGRERWSCPALLPQVVLVDRTADGSTARRALDISGPDARYGGETRVPVLVRGRHGEIVTDYEHDSLLTLSWTEPDGARWVIHSSGLTRTGAIAVAEGLRIQAGVVVPASLPGGYDLVRIAPRPAPGAAGYWVVEYGAEANGPGQEQPVSLSVRRPGPFGEGQAPMVAPGAARFVDLDGTPATYTPTPGGVNALDWRTPQGVTFTLEGPLDLPHLLALARQLRPAPADDPRFTGVAGN